MKEGEVHTESSEDADISFPQAMNSVLLTIDMQRDFSLPSSAAYIPGTNEAVPSIRTLVDAFRAANRPIVHVIRLYLPDGSNADLPRRAQLAAGNRLVCPGTPGAELVDQVNPDPGIKQDAELLLRGEVQEVRAREWLMYKPRWGAFYGTGMEELLRELDANTLVICGCNFPNCPRATIYEASERDFRIVFVPDAASGVYPRGLAELTGIGVAVWDSSRCATWVSRAITPARRSGQ